MYDLHFRSDNHYRVYVGRLLGRVYSRQGIRKIQA